MLRESLDIITISKSLNWHKGLPHGATADDLNFRNISRKPNDDIWYIQTSYCKKSFLDIFYCNSRISPPFSTLLIQKISKIVEQHIWKFYVLLIWSIKVKRSEITFQVDFALTYLSYVMNLQLITIYLLEYQVMALKHSPKY